MLLVQNVPDDKQIERAMVEKAVARFLKSGGKIHRIGVIERDLPGLFCGEQHRSRATLKARSQLETKMKTNMPDIIARHRKGDAISAIAKHYRTSSPTIKRYLLAAGEDPMQNQKQPAVSLEQVMVVKAMVESGSGRADIISWTGLTPKLLQQTINDYEFKHLEK